MSYQAVQAVFQRAGILDHITRRDMTGDTVEHAAQVIGCAPAEIAKTLSFLVDGAPVLVVMAGDAKVNSSKFKSFFHRKPSMIPHDQVEAFVGHAPGGVCPFAVKEGVPIYLDASLKRFSVVHTAAGTDMATIRVSLAELETLSGAAAWIDVCTGWFANEPVISDKKEDKTMERKIDVMERLAPCGLHCGKCFAFSGGEIHDAAVRLRKYLGNFAPYAERFAEQLDPVFLQYPAFAQLLDYLADASCGGCRVEKCKFYKNCMVRACAQKKQVNFCYECPEFPCGHTGLDENLCQRHVAINQKIKEIGAEAYYKEIKDKPRY